MVACTTLFKVSRRTKEDRNKTNGRNSKPTDFCFALVFFVLSLSCCRQTRTHTVFVWFRCSYAPRIRSLCRSVRSLVCVRWYGLLAALSCTWSAWIDVCVSVFRILVCHTIQFHMSNANNWTHSVWKFNTKQENTTDQRMTQRENKTRAKSELCMLNGFKISARERGKNVEINLATVNSFRMQHTMYAFNSKAVNDSFFSFQWNNE